MRGPSFEETKGPGMTAPGETSRQPLEPKPSSKERLQTPRAVYAGRPTGWLEIASAIPNRMRASPLTLPEQTWNASEMTRADWMAAERAFNRREKLPKEYEMGQGRWSKWCVGGEERHTIEFGFTHRFDIRAGPRSDGHQPDFWYASSHEGSLGEFPTFEAAAQACEDEARRLIEPTLKSGDASYDMKLIEEQWSVYLALPNRLWSRKSRTRYK